MGEKMITKLQKIIGLTTLVLSATVSYASGGDPAPADNFKAPSIYGTDRPFDQYAWLTAHNAFASDDYGWTHKMQSMTIPAMLDLGTRGLMLDTHLSDGDIYLCHGNCNRDGFGGPLLWESMLSLTWAMNTVGDWLNRHPNEVVTLILEDYINDSNLFRSAIERSNYEHMVFDIDGHGVNVSSGGWPSLQWMINNNKRIVILTSKSSNGYYTPYASREWSYEVQNTYNIGVPGSTRDYSCVRRGESSALSSAAVDGSTPHKLFTYNHFRSTPEYYSAEADNRDVLSRWHNYCKPVNAPLPNFVTVDYVELSSPINAVNEFNRLWDTTGGETREIGGRWASSGGRSSTAPGNIRYNLKLQSSSSLTIDLMSSVDTYLYLLDGAGNVITQNDDGGDGYNSRITTSLGAGTYQLVAATYSTGQSGSFTLKTTAGHLRAQ